MKRASMAIAFGLVGGWGCDVAWAQRLAKGHYYEEHTYRLRLSINDPNEQFSNKWTWETYVSAYHNTPPIICNPPPRRTPGVDQWVNANARAHFDIENQCIPTAFSRTRASSNVTPQGDVWGSVIVDGFAIHGVGAQIQRAAASSFSKLQIQKETLDAVGNIRWRSGWFLAGSVRDGATSRSYSSSRDPIEVAFRDLDTGEERRSVLFDSRITLTSEGWSSWDPAERQIRISSPGDAGFYVVVDSPYITTGTGAMQLTVENGRVTAAEDWGIFEGLIPVGVGDPALDVRIPWDYQDGELEIGFDFGFAPNIGGFLFTGDLTNDGEASFEFVPSPAPWIALTVVGTLGIGRRRRC